MSSEIRVPAGLTTDGLLWRRYIARAIDTIAIIILLGLLVLVWSVVRTGTGNGAAADLSRRLLLLLLWLGYGTVLESSSAQATIGKRLLGLRVYNAQGGRLVFMQAAGRNLVKDGPFLVLGLITGNQLVMLAWLAVHLVVMHHSPVYQAIHDRVAHTWVAAPEQTTQLRIA